MSKLLRPVIMIVPAILLSFSSLSLVQAAPPSGVCSGDGQHQEVNANRFSFKGVVTGISSDSKTITLCGKPIDLTNANVKGDVQAAKTNGWLVSAVGSVKGTAFIAQEVMVYSQDEPSGVTGNTQNNQETDSGSAQGADHSQGQNKSNGHDQNDGKSNASSRANAAASNAPVGSSGTRGKSNVKDTEDPHQISSTDNEQEISPPQQAASARGDIHDQAGVQKQTDDATTHGQATDSQGIPQVLINQLAQLISTLQTLLAGLKL